jgi:hypothetical protein
MGGVAALPSQAAVLIGNLPPTNDNARTTIIATVVNVRQAVSFTLPSGSDYNLNDAILRLGNYGAGATPVVEIRNDSGGINPGNTVLATLTTPASQGSGIFDYTFTPSTPFMFMAGTKYWLYAYTNSGSYDWMASSPGVTPTGIATFNENRTSGNGGASWSNSPTLTSFQINATPKTTTTVPESQPLSGLGVLAVVGVGGFLKLKLSHKRQKKDEA